jgi:hypothetical protein
MAKQRVVHIPGRIPHEIPAEEVERFLKDHPGAEVLAEEVAPPSLEAPRRRRTAKTVSE